MVPLLLLLTQAICQRYWQIFPLSEMKLTIFVQVFSVKYEVKE